jgi:aminoglycoside phosphotransferase (APT) family kinase protein
LAHYFQIDSLEYVKEPQEFLDGWEAYTYGFQLTAAGLPAEFLQPLILRLYGNDRGLPYAEHEFAVQSHLDRLGYPVAKPLLLEKDCARLGGPFMVMAQVPGKTLLRAMLQQPWRLWTAPRQMAKAQVRLHELSAKGFPTARGTVLERRLARLADCIWQHRLAGLKPGLDWLCRHRPEPPALARILHLDFHPINLMQRAGAPLVALDWTEADVGDYHADVATTLLLLDCWRPRSVSLSDRLSIALGRSFFKRWYLRAYRRWLPLDNGKLAYYRAWAALSKLCKCGCMLDTGPEANGIKSTSLQYLEPAHVHGLEAYFQKWTGTTVRLRAADQQ